jgi:thioredoxin 1
MASEHIKQSSDASFGADVLESSKPVLVDYWATWCGPCKAISPLLDAAAADYGDRLSVVKVNIEEAKTVPAQFGVRGVPTLMMFKDGKVAATKVGAVTKAQLAAFIDAHI